MSTNFAIKDLSYFGSLTKSYLKTTGLMIAFTISFLNFSFCLGFIQTSEYTTLYTRTIMELFTQYNWFLVILTFALTLIIVLSENHALLLQRKKDIATMQALGTYPRYLYSYYITELFILVFLAYIIGWAFGFGTFLIFFMIMEGRLENLTWQPDVVYTFILFLLLFVMTYIVNGWELRRIGSKTYNETKSGKVNVIPNAYSGLKLKRFMMERSLSIKLAFNNLIRKGSQYKQLIALVACASTILLTGFVGTFVISTTTANYIDKAQGKYIYAIGPKIITQSLNQNYERFRNPNLPPLSTQECINSTYNLTSFESLLPNFLKDYGTNEIPFESRFYIVETVMEGKGYYINESKDYQWVGQGGRTRTIIIQGVNYTKTIQHWETVGNYSSELNGTYVGDTFASELFENAYQQRFIFKSDTKNRTMTFIITGTCIDSLNNGNDAYVELDELQDKFEIGNFTNLILIDYTSILQKGQVATFFKAISALIQTMLGDQFDGIDLSTNFYTNRNMLQQLETTTLELAIIMSVIIIYAMYQFQKGRLEEEQKDLFIIRAMGANSSLIHKTTFIEQSVVVTIGLTVGLAGSMLLVIFLLIENATMPSINIPFLFYGITLIAFLIITAISTKILTKKYYNESLLNMIRV